MNKKTYDPHLKDEAASGQGGDAGGERIAKALARAGVASRREVERLVEAGRVALNGIVLTHPAVKVGDKDILTVDGVVVGSAEPTRVFRYHKPVGLVTTHNDPKGRPTVFQALPKEIGRVISVGRLDLNSEGLLLLTNDGGLTRALELPSSGWPRRYRARAFGHTTQEKLDRLKNGITVEGVKYGPIEASLDKAKGPDNFGRNVWITVTLAEGKNREVRRVLEALDLKVNRLIRLAYGPFSLGTLAPGEVEEVGPRVIRELLAEHITPGSMPLGDRPAYRGSGAVVEADEPAPRRGGGKFERRAPGPEKRDDRKDSRRGPPRADDRRDDGPRKPGGRDFVPRRPRDEDERPRGPAARPGVKAGGFKKPFRAPGLETSDPRRADKSRKPRPGAAADAAADKPVYKAGWAKPKKKPSHAPKKPDGPKRPGPKKG
ncbi:pseudouridine synthase [Caulobacter sp. NIBR2454]|uniref:pseudouridine synthase n=1 Tax=Caulobacter sp. NIBR2454 TaxID=3015996 RepID=UPI0022B6C913|nr:pseudouridine synthase [Caulobacter sp. NIBR2454]